MTHPSHTVRSPRIPSLKRLPVALCLVGVAVAGCGEAEQITRYPVPKDETRVTDSGPFADSDDVQQFEVDSGPVSAWIYKLLGPVDAVAAQREPFDALVDSTVVSGGNATWTTPDGWSQQPGSEMRFATLVVDGSAPPLELSVTKLPLRAEPDEYLLQNINRWRGQVGLPGMSGADWLAQAKAADEVVQSQVGVQEVTLVALEGRTEEFGESLMLAAIFLPEARREVVTRPAESIAPPRSSPASDELLTYQAPEQWQPGKKSVMRVAAFVVTDGEKQVEITVIPAGGDLLANVNRWRGQIGLEPWTDDELKTSAAELSVANATASYVQLEGAEQTILAAVLPDGGQSWFFKLIGDPKLAQRETERFKSFVESVRLK